MKKEIMKKEIKLTQDPYICGPVDAPYYEAAAIDLDGDPDMPAYVVRWALTDEQRARMASPDYDGDETDACDWGEYRVYEGGRYIGDQGSVTLLDPRGEQEERK